MPRVAFEIKDTYKSVVRPACLSVIRQMMGYTGIPESTEIHFNDERNHYRTKEQSEFGSNSQLTINAKALYTERGMLTTALFQNENELLFRDEDLGVYLKPVYGETELTIEVSYRTQDRQTGEEWLNNVKRRVATGKKELMHSLEYHYLIPNTIPALLSEIHRLRENVAGYGEDLRAYFNGRMVPRVTKVTDQAGNNARVAVREAQHNVVGYFSFETVPELEKEESGSTWLSTFTYTVEFDRISNLTMEYPMTIHNQPLGQDFIKWTCDNNAQLEDFISTMTQYGLRTINPDIPALSTLEGWTIPCADEWYPKQKRKFTTVALRLMLMVDPSDPQNLVNLTQLGEHELVEQLVDYMKERHDKLMLLGHSAVHLTLYRGDDFMSEEDLEVDNELNVRSKVALDIRSRYHLTLSFVNDLSILSDEATEDLRYRGEFCKWLLGLLDTRLSEEPPRTIESSENVIVPKDVFIESLGKIKTSNKMFHGNNPLLRLAVASFAIVAKKQQVEVC